jgi:hypothetical protein
MPSRGVTSPVTHDTDTLQKALSSPVSRQLTEPSVPLSVDVETVNLTADEEPEPVRTTSSSAVSGAVGDLESMYSVNAKLAGLK